MSSWLPLRVLQFSALKRFLNSRSISLELFETPNNCVPDVAIRLHVPLDFTAVKMDSPPGTDYLGATARRRQD